VLLVASIAAAKPNVVVILSDDQGWGDLSLHGNTNLKTPHLDSLGRDGARFERFYVQPVCSPTRAEFLTGRYHTRGGVVGVSLGGERLNLDESTIAEAFQKAGYATGCFGKWHNGSQYPYHPNGRGFDEFYGFTHGHWADYFDPPLDHNGKDVKGKGFITDDLTDRGIGYFTQQAKAGKPFFAYFAFNVPHSPMQVPDAEWKRFESADLKLRGAGKEDLAHTRAALAMTENMDANVGRILAALKEQKLDQNTIVVYFNDNGPNGNRWNGGMGGIKGSVLEGGVRSPLHVRWPGTIPAGKMIEPVAGAIDLMPTLLGLAKVERVGTKPLDGKDLSAWLTGEAPKSSDRILFQHWGGNTTARSQTFRMANTKLYHLADDPGQTKDVSAAHPEVAKTLARAIDGWKRDVPAGKKDPRPYPVGYAAFPQTILPARDGNPVGGIQRSANAPNCSYFTNWTMPRDRMTWPVEVATAGKYEAIVHYTCPESELGSNIVLNVGEVQWKGTIAQAFDPPLRGKDVDRVTRKGESYMKDFQPLSLGVLDLPKGMATLSLGASTVAKASVADVLAVELVLKPSAP
jgi:arylsulfatase A-like enzyme